ncbi:MAG TPA: AraC family transcriptional regulator [bacterium]
MDALTDLLAEVRLQGTLYFRATLGGEWGVRFQRRGRAPFYIVTQGQCLVELEGRATPIVLRTGDLLILPRGQAHVLKSSPGAPVMEREEFNARHPMNARGQAFLGVGKQPVTVLDGGFFASDETERSALVEALPPVLHLKASDGRVASWLEPTLRFIAVEREEGQQGSQAVLSRLADILFVQAIRAHLKEAPPRRAGWLRGLADPQIAEALAAMHRHPEQNWTVLSLARHVGMSRTAFSSRFARLVGTPPLHYLAQWRVHRAAQILRTEGARLGAVAERVGYGSEPALSRAFKRIMKTAPGHYRQQARRASAD